MSGQRDMSEQPQMSGRQIPLLVPQYMQEFACIGPECEDTCCIGWRVNVDEATYKKYRQVRNPELKPLLDKQVTRNRSNPTPNNFAKIKMNQDRSCPFLAEDLLCDIHRNLGESYLSTTCATYPRTTNVVNGVRERSATMSCPEAARLALLNPEPMEFDQLTEPRDVRNGMSRQLDTHAVAHTGKLEKHLWDMRIFSIHLLQERSYDLWERLVILGLFYQQADQYVQNKQTGELTELIAKYTRIVADGSVKESLAGIPAQTGIQMKLLKELTDQRIRQGITSQRYLQCLKEFLLGLQHTKDATPEELAQRYEQAYQSHYHPFMKDREYIFENYLVNYVFKNLFPLGRRGAFGEYVTMVMHYAMIKMHLIGMSAHHQGLTEELVIKLIQSFAKTVEHNRAYLDRIYTLMQDSDFVSMPYMAILIKN